MANITKITKYAEILKTKIVTDFSLGTVIEWSAQGIGVNFFLRTRTADSITNNFPVVGVSIITQNYKLTPAADIFAAYFSSLPAGYLANATMLFTTNTVQIWRNIEE
jgi:hypothetical protein